MKYYIFIQDEKINGKGECKCLNDDILNIEVDEEIYNNIEKYIYQDGDIILNPNYEEELVQKEKERIAKLYLTGADVERGIFKARGADFEDIIKMIGQMQINSDPRTEGIELKALKIELKANNFYRGNPYVSAIGALLGFSDEQLDLFFETNDYTVLLPKEEPIETPSEEAFNLEE